MPRRHYTDDQIRRAIKKTCGNAKAAADLLGCAPFTVYSRARKLGLKTTGAIKTTRPETAKADVEDSDLWAAYKAGDSEAANAIATKHVPLARTLVGRLKKSLPSGVDPNDLFGAALDGLLQAMQGFDPQRGHKFATYAARRIHGAILDELRVLDFVPRLTRRMQRGYEVMRQYWMQEHGREPTEDEVLDTLGWSAADARKARVRNVGSLDAVRYETGSGREARAIDQYVARPERDHRMVVDIEHVTRGVCLESRMIMFAYFAIGHTLKEIGDFLLLSESRVSQLMSNGLAELRKNEGLKAEYRKQMDRDCGNQIQKTD
jgi:RNA polymerase sigma factor for flagellar operon FliA